MCSCKGQLTRPRRGSFPLLSHRLMLFGCVLCSGTTPIPHDQVVAPAFGQSEPIFPDFGHPRTRLALPFSAPVAKQDISRLFAGVLTTKDVNQFMPRRLVELV